MAIPNAISAARHPLLHEVYCKAQWAGDGFPSHIVLSDEIEKWLRVAQAHNQWQQYFPKLTKVNPRMRDERLQELAVAFFLEQRAGLQIVQWEPEGKNGTRGEYLCIDPINTDQRIFCEVKSPGWEAAFIREQGHNTPRIRGPKWVSGEARGAGHTPDLWHCLDKAYEKFPECQPTLLIVADDLLPPLDVFNLFICRTLHYRRLPGSDVDNRREGAFISAAFERLGGVALFEFRPGYHFTYHFRMFPNRYAVPEVKLPDGFVSRWRDVCFCER